MITPTQARVRARRLERRLSGTADWMAFIDGKNAALEASLHEVGHIVALRGSLRDALRMEPIADVNLFMKQNRLFGITRDENEISALAMTLLVAEKIAVPIDLDTVVSFAWNSGNVSYVQYREHLRMRVVTRMQSARCRHMASEVAGYLLAPVKVRR